MLGILFIWTWMRALQIDPNHGRSQRRAQVCFYGCTVPMCVQTFLIILMPFYTECECKEGDVVFVMKNQTFEAVVTAIRYLALLGPYGGFTAVNYSVFLMPHSTDVNMRNAQIKTPKDSKDVDKIAPFDKEDVAKELRDHAAKTQDMHKMDVPTIYLVLFAAIFEKQLINLEVPGYVTSISNVLKEIQLNKIDKIGEAAKKLSDASYPFLKDIDWLSDLHIKPLPGASFTQSLKAVDKTIVMGNAMNGNLLKAFYEFKDVVKAAQRREARGRPEGSSPHQSMRRR